MTISIPPRRDQPFRSRTKAPSQHRASDPSSAELGRVAAVTKTRSSELGSPDSLTAARSAAPAGEPFLPTSGGRGVQGPGNRRLGILSGWGWLVPIAVAGLFAVAWMQFGGRGASGPQARNKPTYTIPAPYNADRAFRYLVEICDLGPRPSASDAMLRQQEMLTEFFKQQGAAVELQPFRVRHPETGEAVELANLIARWFPDRPKRYLLAAHYDTRPFPDRDPVNPRGRFVGANDGASGVAALMELSHHVDQLPADVGIDIVLFDGEELVYKELRDEYFLGSTFFAREYVANPPAIPYQAGILLDMVGDKELTIYYERNSWRYARELTKSIFETAQDLGVDAFIPRLRHEIRDDHLPLNLIAKIPTTDLIDFEYPRPGIGAPQYWHTTQDVPENCSGHSLATVVYVVHQWLMRQ